MGISFGNALFLANARREGARFDDTVTIGHLGRNMTRREVERVASRFDVPRGRLGEVVDEEFAIPFLKVFLGAERVSSLDYSDYEGCDIVHDLNVELD